jgi:hypothetical protein
MKKIEAPCPSCGAPVEFKVSSSLVTICEFCHSVVARGDRQLEDLGKVAALVETNSPLGLGVTGRFGDKPFELVGHVQYRHSAGGIWDEWYAAFPGNRWGWLAEAQGKFYLTFRTKKSDEISLPPSESVGVGTRIELPKVGSLVVHERNTATLIAAEGELPYRPAPGASHAFADLSGEHGRFGTLDLNEDPPTLFVGQQVTLDELGISIVTAEEYEPKIISAQGLACPHCGGSLDLKAPDKAERVTCPYCDSLLDVNAGNLVYLKTLKKMKVEPIIPLGAVGTLRGREFTCIGFLRRSVSFDKIYYWTEYLLYHPQDGFFWLVNSDRHWSFVEPITIGEVKQRGQDIVYKGEAYKLFQRAMATVRNVQGEFYWKVEVGELVEAADYVAPPHMISVETTGHLQQSQEVNVSLGTYLPREEVQVAFKLPALAGGFGVAPNQPNPTDTGVFWSWPLVVIFVLLVYMAFKVIRPAGSVDAAWLWIALVLVSLYPAGVWLYMRDFEKRRWADSEFNPYATGEE